MRIQLLTIAFPFCILFLLFSPALPGMKAVPLKRDPFLDNIKYSWQQVGSRPGWETRDSEAMTLLKCPVNIGSFNICYLKKKLQDPDEIARFYGRTSYGVIFNEGDLGEFAGQAKVITDLVQMQLPDEAFECNRVDEGIGVVSGEEELEEWCQVAGEVFSLESSELLQFVKEMLPLEKNCKLIYCTKNGKRVGTGQIYMDCHRFVYVSNIAVLEAYRRKGIGTSILKACLIEGRKLGAQQYILYAVPSAESLYQRLQFREARKRQFALF